MIPLIVQALRQPDKSVYLDLTDWDLLIRQARQANLLARLHALLDERGLLDRVPQQPLAHLRWSYIVAERRTQAIRQEVILISRALTRTGPFVLMKGTAYLMAGLPPARGRLFSDIDLMVAKENLNQVEADLMLHGWATTHHDAYDQRYYRTWMHELPPMMHTKRLSVIDVHHAILPETAFLHPDSQKLLQAALFIDGYPGLKILAPVDMVLHSATHLFHEAEFDKGLRDLADIDSLLRHFSTLPAFWETLVRRAGELDLIRPLFYALRYTALLLHTPIPDKAIQTVRAGSPNRILLAVMDALFTRGILPDHPSCSDWLTGTARFLLFLRGTWLRMPPFLLMRHLFHKAFLSPRSE